MSSSIQLHRSRKSGRTTSYNCNLLSGSCFRLICRNQPMFKRIFNDCFFIFFCSYWKPMCVTSTCCFTKSRTDMRSELWKTMCFRKPFIRLFQIALIYQIIHFRNQIMQWASGSHSGNHHSRLTERNATIHTACRLLLLFF